MCTAITLFCIMGFAGSGVLGIFEGAIWVLPVIGVSMDYAVVKFLYKIIKK